MGSVVSVTWELRALVQACGNTLEGLGWNIVYLSHCGLWGETLSKINNKQRERRKRKMKVHPVSSSILMVLGSSELEHPEASYYTASKPSLAAYQITRRLGVVRYSVFFLFFFLFLSFSPSAKEHSFPPKQLWALAFVVGLNFRKEGIVSIFLFSASASVPHLGHNFSMNRFWRNEWTSRNSKDESYIAAKLLDLYTHCSSEGRAGAYLILIYRVLF